MNPASQDGDSETALCVFPGACQTPDMADGAKRQLETLFIRDAAGRIISTREPQPKSGPVFILIRSATECAWAIHTDISTAVADELNRLAREELPISNFHEVPLHADRYTSLLGGKVRSGPAFTFPQTITQPPDTVLIEDEQLLARHFTGWVPGEIRAGRAPVMAVIQHGFPVSVCLCARRSKVAAEAGVETAPAFRGRGYGARVTAAWALAVRASHRIPLYSTDWSNVPSLALARKLGLEIYAADWSIYA